MPFLPPVPGLRAPALAFVAQGLVWAGFAAQVPVIKDQIGASDAMFGILSLVASLGAIASVWIAPKVDRMLGAYSVAATSALLGLAFVGIALAPGAVSYVVVFILLSAISGVSDIVMNARTSEVEAARDQSYMSLNHGIFAIAYAITAVLTGLARDAGFTPFSVFLVIALLISGMSFFMHAPHAETDDEGEFPGIGIPHGVIWVGGLVVLAGFFNETAVEGWSALYIERDLGGNATAGALGPAILGLTLGIGRLSGHALTRYFRDTSLILGACLTSSFGAVVVALAVSPVMAQIGFGIMGLGISLVVPLAIGIIGRSVPAPKRVMALARASAVGYGAFVFGPPIMGVVAQTFSLSVAFAMVGVIMVGVAAGLIPALVRQLRRADGEV